MIIWMFRLIINGLNYIIVGWKNLLMIFLLYHLKTSIDYIDNIVEIVKIITLLKIITIW